TNVAGSPSGTFGNSGDGGQAASSLLHYPGGLWGDSANQYMYISCAGSATIRRVDLPSGIISLYGGTPNVHSLSGDGGPVASAKFKVVRSVWGDATGNLFIMDCENFAVRKVAAGTNIITRYAGTYGVNSALGDGGPAL